MTGAQFSISNHPLIKHKLSFMRQSEKITSSREYADLISEIGMLLAYEASASLALKDITYRADIDGRDWKPGFEIQGEPTIVPVVRPGLLLADGVKKAVPTSIYGHIGIDDDARTEKPYEVFTTMPSDVADRPVIICDLFIGRGWVTSLAIDILVNRYRVPPRNIKFVCLIASAKGRALLEGEGRYEGIIVHCAHADDIGNQWLPDFSHTNERIFGTTNRSDELAGYNRAAFGETE